MKTTTSTKKMVLMAMLAAIAYLSVALFPSIPVVVTPQLSYEPKDAVITMSGFLLGPLASVIISLVVSLLEMVTVSKTGWIGAIMNFASTCSFACTAALIYKRKHNLKGAIFGLLTGCIAMVSVMLLWNWILTPIYKGWPRSAVEPMLIPVFLPFNALKAGLNTALVLALYKPLTTALRRARLLPESQSRGKMKAGVYVFAGLLLATCILLFLVMQGVI